MRHLLIGLLILIIATPALAENSQPIEILQQGIDDALRVLSTPVLDGSNRNLDRQRMLRKIMAQLFNFREFSRRVLASHWETFTALQQETFVEVFADFLSTYYIRKILERYRDESVIYIGQTIEAPTRALVNVAVVWRGQPVPVDLRMIKSKGMWKVYEIQVLGISAVSFYRAQFKSLLRKETPAQVIDRIRRQTRKIE